MDVLDSTRIYITLPWLCFSLLDSTLLYHGSTSTYYTQHYSTMTILRFTRLYITLQWLYFTVYLYLILHYSTMVLLHSTSLYITLHQSTMAINFTRLDSILLYHDLLHSTRLYITLQWLYFTLVDSTFIYHDYTSLS